MATYIWRRRPAVILVSIIIFGMIGLSPLVQEKTSAISDGSPYVLDDVTDTDPDPDVVETTITAQGAMVDLGNGVTASALTFNGKIPGPLFRLKVGDRVKVHFINNAGHPTGIHWHGIELSNPNDGTPLTQNLVPQGGGTFEYDFVVSRPGLFWYHPHHHSSTNQVFKGMYGPIIVTDPNEAALQAAGILPAAEDTIPLLLSDTTVCKSTNDAKTYNIATQPWLDGSVALSDQQGPFPVTLCKDSPIDEDGAARAPFAAGEIPNIQRLTAAGQATNEGQTVLTNGKNVGPRSGTIAGGDLDPAPAGIESVDVQPGQGIRLQLINAATIRFFRLRLTDGEGTTIPLVRVGGQGGLLDQAIIEGGVITGADGDFDTKYSTGEILLDPGDRQDVVAAIPDTATGVLTLWTLDVARTGGGSGFTNTPTVPVAHFNVTGAAVSPAFTIDSTTQLRLHTGDPVEVLGPADGSLLDPTTFVGTFDPPLLGTDDPDIVLSNNIGGKLGINGVVGAHDSDGDFTDIEHPLSSRYANLGDTLALTTTNETLAHHPFHLHGFSIQPLTLTKEGSPSYTFPRHEYRDNIDVPAGYTLSYRVRIDDRNYPDGTPGGAIGRWVFHCHIFFHAVFGMISEFDVVALPKVEVDDAAGNEGAAIPIHATATDPLGGSLTTLWSIAPSGPVDAGTVCTIADPNALDTTVSCNDNGTFTLTLTATNSIGSTDGVGTLTVANVPPDLTLTAPASWQVSGINTPIAFNATITDPATNDVLTCTFDWDNPDPDTVISPPVAGACNTSKTFTVPGVYTVNVTGTDDDSGSDSASVVVVVVDPNGGFVTGGGTIDSPAGALAADPALTGKANFGFVSKYQKGATAATPPNGEVEFQFHAGGVNFHSAGTNWLVVVDGKAMYRGTGTINGTGTYGFFIVAYDGQGPGSVDRFRIKIWNAANTVIYDNRPGASEDIDTADPQAIANGSVQVHK